MNGKISSRQICETLMPDVFQRLYQLWPACASWPKNQQSLGLLFGSDSGSDLCYFDCDVITIEPLSLKLSIPTKTKVLS